MLLNASHLFEASCHPMHISKYHYIILGPRKVLEVAKTTHAVIGKIIILYKI